MSSIYLISPPKIDEKDFLKNLTEILKTGLCPLFQLRLKDYEKSEILRISKTVKKICSDFNSKFILNDFADIALEARADGVHVGSEDELVLKIRKESPENFIIGASCYDSLELAQSATLAGASYVSFGAFFPSKTKNSKGKPTIQTIIDYKKNPRALPVSCIGGIDDKNCKELVLGGADYICVISYIWESETSVSAIKNLHASISSS